MFFIVADVEGVFVCSFQPIHTEAVVRDSKGRKTAVLLPVRDYEEIKACHESRENRKSGVSDQVSLDKVLKVGFSACSYRAFQKHGFH